MSRVGKRIIMLPANVQLQVNEFSTEIVVHGPLGSLTKKLPGMVKIVVNESTQTVTTQWTNKNKKGIEMWGTTNSLLYNWVYGVEKGFQKRLLINGLGFKAQVVEKILQLNLGFSHQVNYVIPDTIKIVVEKKTTLIISGIDKELVGLVASQIRKIRKPEPYKGKGIMYDNEKVQRKVGKTAMSKK